MGPEGWTAAECRSLLWAEDFGGGADGGGAGFAADPFNPPSHSNRLAYSSKAAAPDHEKSDNFLHPLLLCYDAASSEGDRRSDNDVARKIIFLPQHRGHAAADDEADKSGNHSKFQSSGHAGCFCPRQGYPPLPKNPSSGVCMTPNEGIKFLWDNRNLPQVSWCRVD